MYGTIANFTLKPGKENEFINLMGQYDQTPGLKASYLYKSDDDPNKYMLVVVFKDRDLYWENANSPAQHERYLKMRALLEEDPDWNDGEIVDSRHY